ncbi:MAG: SMC-Scp complex subunit ScpB, partial [Candidatus Niyogibacteria bacterium]|nr:SMC-Scp complex subunit ScpB [Candidatus Niyogibacteria bacterium]
MELAKIIEALLFVHGDPMRVSRLANLLGREAPEVEEALTELGAQLGGRGLTLLRNGDEVMLGTAPEAASFVENLVKEEFAGKLTKAALDTLAIIVYYGPISRPDIDFIRGVNSSFSLRNLLISGLVERTASEKDKRVYIYKPSMRFLEYLGITRLEDLPEYEDFRKN